MRESLGGADPPVERRLSFPGSPFSLQAEGNPRANGERERMMRQALNHSKMKRLCRRMDIPQWQGVGLLESIWHLTARETPRGDIGKLSDEDIALAIDYHGDETKLIEALASAGWLDRHPEARLVVHDWHEHADDSVNMRLARARQFFVTGQSPKLSKLPGRERQSAANLMMGAAVGNP